MKTNSSILHILIPVILAWLPVFQGVADASIRYVWQSNPSPAAPYTNWATAAHVIQDAVDMAVDGDTVVVTNGVSSHVGAYEYGMLSPSEAIEELILAIEESSLDNRRKRSLQTSLLAALACLDRDQVKAGVNQLKAFQNKVTAQVRRIDAQLAEDLIGATQEIIDALTPPEPGPMPNMVWIEPGTFIMGSPLDEPARFDNEGPQTEVTISQGFWLGAYEVTQGEYLDMVGSNPSYFKNGKALPYGGTGGPVTNELLHPVEQVSWYDATNYCALLTERERAAGRLPEGWEYRLPTEAQWEYACRAGTTTPFSFGSELRSGNGYVNFNGQYEYPPCGDDPEYCYNPNGIHLGRTAEVGSYLPNAWGLYDMHGNVDEWCQDWWSDSLAGGSVTDPTGPATGSPRVGRGGCWIFYGDFCRSALRFRRCPDSLLHDLGFRVALVSVP